MNYLLHYNTLISRARNRQLDCYTESHHIIPQCMNGTDDKSNLVDLTPEEHFVAHQLLVKIYPSNRKLILAVNMMCVSSAIQLRNNKRYGWLKRQMSKEISHLQSGKLNSQFGTLWIYHTEYKVSKKIKINEKDKFIADGWNIGRKFNFDEKISMCCICNTTFLGNRKTCGDTCKSKLISKNGQLKNPLLGREQEFLELYKKNGSMNSALKEMGFPGASSNYHGNAKKILNNWGLV